MTVPVDDSWTLTFNEEFNGTSLNKTVWGSNWLGNPGAITKPVNGYELGAYDPAQVSVSDGYLNLGAVKSPATVNGVNYQYRSGMVNTHDSFNQTFGYFEARIHTPGKNGEISNWPAFWLNGESWPYDGELDIMEGLGGSAAYHFHSPSGGPGKAVPGDYTGWHTYGAMWEPGKVSYYYDDKLVGTISSGITDSPMYMILNHGIGADSIGGPISAPSEMLVDWVRVYSNDPKAVAAAPQQNYDGLVGGGNTPPKQSSAITGTSNDDTLVGTGASDYMHGMAGNDTITANGGNDILRGGRGSDDLRGNAGADQLRGGAGADRLTGGAGADTFFFGSVMHSAPNASDVILDFNRSENDRISLAAVDANEWASGDQAFSFIGNKGFTGQEGQLNFKLAGSGIVVSGDTDGNGYADISIRVEGINSIMASDFIL
jgi:beta-glucanase (GH16 family)